MDTTLKVPNIPTVCSSEIEQAKSEKRPINSGYFVAGQLYGVPVDFLFDTGSVATLISTNVYLAIPESERPRLEPSKIKLAGVNGANIGILGTAEMNIEFAHDQYKLPVIVCQIECDAILGQDFVMDFVLKVDLKKMTLTTELADIPMHLADKSSMVCRVMVRETISIPPKSIKTIPLEVPSNEYLADDMLIEPTKLIFEKKKLFLTPAIIQEKTNPNAAVINLSDNEVQLYPNMCLGSGQSVYNQERKGCANTSASKIGIDQIPPHVQDLFNETTPFLNNEQIVLLKQFLIRFQDIFAKNSDDLGRTNRANFIINTEETTVPIRQKCRRQPFGKRDAEKKEIERMMKTGIIEESNSSWASPIVLIQKKDGTYRFCVDYRKLNDATIKDAFPLPNIQDCLDALSGSSWYSSCDLQSGFWQVPINNPEDREKTAFVTSFGLYQFTVLAFGLTNAPACFSRLMADVLRGLQWSDCVLFIDDTIIPSSTFEEGLERLEKVFIRFEEAGLKVKPSKCSLFRREVKFLGHIVSGAGVSTDPEKTKAIDEWPQPKNAKQVRSFCGLCGYYRRFVPDFAQISRPLYYLCGKGIKFDWSSECETAFQNLKQKLVTAPILAYPEPGKPYILDTDASDLSVGSVLSQNQDGNERVIAYFSQTLTKTEIDYCVTRKELLAVIKSLRKFHSYLYGQEILLRTDNSAVSWVRSLQAPSGQVARWLQELGTYNLTVTHRPGTQHRNADALSRRPCAACARMTKQDEEWSAQKEKISEELDSNKPGYVNALQSEEQPGCSHWETKPSRNVEKLKSAPFVLEGWDAVSLRQKQLEDPAIAQILNAKELSEQRPLWDDISDTSKETKILWATWDTLTVENGLLFRNLEGKEKQIVVPNQMQKVVLEHLHDLPTGAHLCAEKVLEKARSLFYWPQMKKKIELYIQQCDLCAARKLKKRKHAYLGGNQLGEPMERISLDILGPLPVTDKGNKFVLVITDLYSKWTEAFGVPDQEAKTIANVFLNEFVCRFGTPLQILSDQGRNFESQLFQELCKLLKIDKIRTSPLHPQSNGVVERFNRTLGNMLAMFCENQQRSWDEHLPKVMMAYRSAINSTTNYTPNQIVLGRNIVLPLQAFTVHPSKEGVSIDQYVANLQQLITQIHEDVRINLKKAANYRKKQYDVHAVKKQFVEGQLIWLYDPIRKLGVCQKFVSKWKGPFLVTKRIDDLNYFIKKSAKQLPKIVHVDRLMPYKGNQVPKWIIQPKKI